MHAYTHVNMKNNIFRKGNNKILPWTKKIQPYDKKVRFQIFEFPSFICSITSTMNMVIKQTND